MALILVPLGGAAAAGTYLYGAVRLAQACDGPTRQHLVQGSTAASVPGRHHTGVFAAGLGLTWALGARMLRPVFGRLRVPGGVESYAEFIQTLAPGLIRHGIAATAGVAVGGCASAAYDVREQRSGPPHPPELP